MEANLTQKLSKYLLQGLIVSVVVFCIPKKSLKIGEVAGIALASAITFAVLDNFAGKVLSENFWADPTPSTMALTPEPTAPAAQTLAPLSQEEKDIINEHGICKSEVLGLGTPSPAQVAAVAVEAADISKKCISSAEKAMRFADEKWTGCMVDITKGANKKYDIPYFSNDCKKAADYYNIARETFNLGRDVIDDSTRYSIAVYEKAWGEMISQNQLSTDQNIRVHKEASTSSPIWTLAEMPGMSLAEYIRRNEEWKKMMQDRYHAHTSGPSA